MEECVKNNDYIIFNERYKSRKILCEKHDVFLLLL